MKIEVELKKKYFFSLLAILIVLSSALIVYAYSVSPGASISPGHLLSEIQGYFSGDTDLNESLGKFCQSDGTNCQAAGGGSGTPTAPTPEVITTKNARVIDCTSISCPAGQYLIKYDILGNSGQSSHVYNATDTSITAQEGSKCGSDWTNITIYCSNKNDYFRTGGVYGYHPNVYWYTGMTTKPFHAYPGTTFGCAVGYKVLVSDTSTGAGYCLKTSTP